MSKKSKQAKMQEVKLKSAKPRLLCWIEGGLLGEQRLTPYISDVDLGWDEVKYEGFDPSGSPLGPVYYRVVRRANEEFYLSTFMADRDRVLKGWGTAGLAYCDPVTGMAVARLENRLPPPEVRKREEEQFDQSAKDGNREAGEALRMAGARTTSRNKRELEMVALKSAKPRLIYRVENAELTERGLEFDCTRYILSDVDLHELDPWDVELITEGFDESGGSGLGAVYYCQIDRAGEQFVTGTFMAPRAFVLAAWGDAGAACCDPVTGFAPARIEAKLTSRDHLDDPDVVLVRAEMAFLETYGERH